MSQKAGGVAAGQRYASVFRPGLYQGKTIVVTGGGSGLGRCTAHELASLGASLALVGRKLDKLQAAQDEICRIYPEASGRISLHACDIRDEAGVRGAARLPMRWRGTAPSTACSIARAASSRRRWTASATTAGTRWCRTICTAPS